MHNRLTPLQRELLEAFFRREQRMFLTGGAALGGFYFGHRTTEDLDLFAPPGAVELDDAAAELATAATTIGAVLVPGRKSPDFRRFSAQRGEEVCVVDLVIDRAPMIDPEKPRFGTVRVDSTREITANKICALIGRAEIKDLVDLERLLQSGAELERAFEDAAEQGWLGGPGDACVDPGADPDRPGGTPPR